MKARAIRVFSFIVALTLVFAMVSTPAYADFRQMGAWVLSALTALNITWNSTVAPVLQGIDYFEDPFQITDTGIWEYVPYTYDAVDDILDNSTISFSGEDVVIDGKHYQNVWLSHDAAEKFRVNAFDIKTAFDIASESEGTYVESLGTINGVPIYQYGTNIVSQGYSGAGQLNIGGFDSNIELVSAGSTYYDVIFSYEGGSTVSGRKNFYNDTPFRYLQLPDISGSSFRINASRNNHDGYVVSYFAAVDQDAIDLTPIDFDFIASDIPLDEPLPETDGLNLYFPTNPDEWEDDPDTQQIINNYNDYITNNPEFSPGLDVDLDKDSDILDKLGDLIKILSSLINIMPDPQFGPKGEEPEPPEPPVPPTGDLIPDTPWSYLEDLLNSIIQWLSDIYDTILDIPNSIIDAISSLQNHIIQAFAQVKSVLDNILSQLSDLVNKLLNHDVDWFDDIVDSIRQPFMRWFGILKSGVGIWHYVVEWIQYISTPFTFFFGVLSSLGGIFVSPFYAVAAACIVIAIYRRFGR